jgi:hypothetical protein
MFYYDDSLLTIALLIVCVPFTVIPALFKAEAGSDSLPFLPMKKS